jgi:hypothetical protein
MSDRGVWRASGWVIPALLGLCLRAGPAQAQMGTGWTEFTPMKSVQLRGAGARYTNENGIETFSTQPGDERAEARIEDDHRTGTWQFEGWVNVKAGVTGGCIHQVFKFLMIVAYPNDGGEFRQHSYQKLAATNMYDKWVRVNTIHDADAGRADVYIDGTWRGMTPSNSPGPNGWYHKYGIYNSSGTRPVVQWRNVRFFKGGKGDMSSKPSDGGVPAADAGSSPPPSDAGGVGLPTSDGGRPEVSVAVDTSTGAGGAGGSTTGAGGSGGAGGAGATAGTGGAGGTGGTGGTGSAGRGGRGGTGSNPPAPVPETPPGGCTCDVSGVSSPAGGAIAVSGACLLALAFRRRRRRSLR